MGLQRIDYNHILEYLLTLNNAIGPTTSLTLRTLDNASPDDTNSIWLAMNGSDAAAGTEAAPVLTFEKAIDLIQAGAPGKVTINIFRNGYVGDLIFSMDNPHGTGDAIPDDTVIQVELGEVATLTLNDKFGDSTASPKNTKFNGLYINCEDTSNIKLIDVSTTSQFGWCYVKENQSTFERVVEINHNAPTSEKMTFKNSIFDANNKAMSLFIAQTGAGAAFDIDNCILMNATVTPVGYSETFMVQVAGTTGVTNHCIFHNCIGALKTGIASVVHSVKNSIISDVIDAFEVLSTTTINFSHSLISNSAISSDVTQGDGLQFNVLPLYFDAVNEDFRLMDQRREAPDSGELFSFTSKAVYNTDLAQTPSDDTRDLGPYDVSYSLTTDTWEEFEVNNEFWNDKIEIDHVFVNYQPFEDIRGNHRRSFDGIRRRIKFNAIGNNFTGSEDSYKLRDLIRSEGSKKWYPIGDDGMFTDPSGTVTVNDDGDFDAALSVISTLVPNSFEGYICETSSGASTFYLRIKEHSNDSLVLEDHRENQSTMGAGVFNIKCLYLPIEIDQTQSSQIYECWDPKENPLMITSSDVYEHWEGHIRNLVVKETEEDE